MRLSSTSFDKKSYLTYLKGYMKKVKSYLEEKAAETGATEEDKSRPEKFVAAAQSYAKKIIANFKDWEFYTGEGMDPDGMVVLLNYREDGTTPYLVYFKDGLKMEKVVCHSQRALADHSNVFLDHVMRSHYL
jgi:Translationally controlled tumour protein